MRFEQETIVPGDATIGSRIDEAETKATHYMTDTTNGVKVHPDNDTANYVLIQDGVEIFRANERVAKYGTTVRIGKDASTHIDLTSSALQINPAEGVDSLDISVGTREKYIDLEVGTTITEVPYVHNLAYTPKNDDVTILTWTGMHWVTPIGEPYAYTLNGKVLTLTDDRLVGKQYAANYTATDYTALSFNGGNNNEASGAESFAMGSYALATGDQSFAMGVNVTASALQAHAEGNGCTASGWQAHAEGNGCTASGSYSHAEGEGTTASGTAAHAEGWNTTASQYNAHAEGKGTTASGPRSHAEGESSTASSMDSHAEGYKSTASGIYSHAQNEGTIAEGGSQTALGRYNIADTVNAIILGNGSTEVNRSNALTVDWNGNVTCGTVNGVDLTTISGASIETITDWNTAYDSSKPVRYLFGNNATNTPASGAQIIGIELNNAANNRMQMGFRVGSGTSNSFFVRHAPNGTWGTWTEFGGAPTSTSTGISGINAVKNGIGVVMLYFASFSFAANTGTDSTAYRLPAGLRPPVTLDLLSTHNNVRFFVTTDGYIRPAVATTAATAIRGTFTFIAS